MSGAQHTPGPWGVEDPLGPDILSIVAGGPEVSDWLHIAQVSADGDDEDIPVSQAKANAALIAAAPDLLAALQEVVRISDRKHDAWDAARAAIAKATGQDGAA